MCWGGLLIIFAGRSSFLVLVLSHRSASEVFSE